MADEAESRSLLEDFAAKLLAHGVEFIVIGGQAENLHGSPRVTYDVDLCYRRTPENLARLAGALTELKVRLRGAPPDLPFRLDARSLAAGTNFTFAADMGDLDLLGYVEPLGGYDEVAAHATTIRVGGMDLRVISLDDLLRIKRHIKRPKDRESLHHLEAIKRQRERGGGTDT